MSQIHRRELQWMPHSNDGGGEVPVSDRRRTRQETTSTAPTLTYVSYRLFSASNSSKVRGQSAPNSLDSARSASTRPPVWHFAQ